MTLGRLLALTVGSITALGFAGFLAFEVGRTAAINAVAPTPEEGFKGMGGSVGGRSGYVAVSPEEWDSRIEKLRTWGTDAASDLFLTEDESRLVVGWVCRKLPEEGFDRVFGSSRQAEKEMRSGEPRSVAMVVESQRAHEAELRETYGDTADFDPRIAVGCRALYTPADAPDRKDAPRTDLYIAIGNGSSLRLTGVTGAVTFYGSDGAAVGTIPLQHTVGLGSYGITTFVLPVPAEMANIGATTDHVVIRVRGTFAPRP